ncbi:hypothetical protein GCM10009504_47650 [Pseudomonas laurentiana]|nr:hypothetical protein GCM10009504_47650 [Pseudomonas laurentiana]
MIERAKETEPFGQKIQLHTLSDKRIFIIEHQLQCVASHANTSIRVSNKMKRQVPPTSSAVAITEWDILAATKLMTIITVSE